MNLATLKEFEAGLNPRFGERSRIPAKVLGYGEISTVLAIEAPGLEGLAFKRMPLFYTQEEVDRYTATYLEYLRLLQEEIGLRLPPHEHASFPRPNGLPVFYIIQQRLPADSIGNRLLHQVPDEAVLILVRKVLRELHRVWDFNRRQNRIQVAIDGQISNWAIADYEPQRLDLENAALLYLDTSTPLFRVNGVEQLDTELFLRSAPSFLVWILRLLFLKDVVDRYYDFHRVAVDLVANFYKEKRADLIGRAVATVNDFFTSEAADLNIQPITEREVRSYYQEDAFIWSLYLAMRKLDRFLRTKVLRGEYPYILPEKIER